MAEDTLSLYITPPRNAATPGDATLFPTRKIGEQMRVWTGASPTGSLADVPTLTRRAQKTKAGIVGRSVGLVVPYTDPAGVIRTIQARVVLNAPAACEVSIVGETLNMLLNAFVVGDFHTNFVLAAEL